MKLRTSIVAAGSAVAMTLAPVVAVPAFAPAAVAATTIDTTGILQSNLSSYRNTMSNLNALDVSIKSKSAELNSKSLADVRADDEANVKLTDAETNITQAKYNRSRANSMLVSAQRETDAKAQASDIADAQTQISKGESYLASADSSIASARSTYKANQDNKFSCPGAVNAGDATTDNGGSSNFSSFFKGGSSNFGSSANRIVMKDGKKKCVSNADYWTSKLTTIGTVLTAILALVANIGKIQSAFQNFLPKAPAAMPR